MGALSGFGCSKRHADALLAKDHDIALSGKFKQPDNFDEILRRKKSWENS